MPLIISGASHDHCGRGVGLAQISSPPSLVEFLNQKKACVAAAAFLFLCCCFSPNGQPQIMDTQFRRFFFVLNVSNSCQHFAVGQPARLARLAASHQGLVGERGWTTVAQPTVDSLFCPLARFMRVLPGEGSGLPPAAPPGPAALLHGEVRPRPARQRSASPCRGGPAVRPRCVCSCNAMCARVRACLMCLCVFA